MAVPETLDWVPGLVTERLSTFHVSVIDPVLPAVLLPPPAAPDAYAKVPAYDELTADDPPPAPPPAADPVEQLSPPPPPPPVYPPPPPPPPAPASPPLPLPPPPPDEAYGVSPPVDPLCE